MTAGDDGTAEVWDAEAGGEALLTLSGHAGVVLSASYSPDGGRIVTAGWDGTAKVWDAEAGGEALLTLSGHTGWVNSASYSPDGGRIVTAGVDGTAKVWPLRGDDLVALAEPLIQRYNPWLTPAERKKYGLD